jgi:4-hydroxybenzoate polyprenyltransferase
VVAIIVFYGVYMLFWLIAGMEYTPAAIKFIVLTLMSAQIFWHWLLIRGRSREGCFKAFKQNHWLGFTLFAGIALSFALH